MVLIILSQDFKKNQYYQKNAQCVAVGPKPVQHHPYYQAQSDVGDEAGVEGSEECALW